MSRVSGNGAGVGRGERMAIRIRAEILEMAPVVVVPRM